MNVKIGNWFEPVDLVESAQRGSIIASITKAEGVAGVLCGIGIRKMPFILHLRLCFTFQLQEKWTQES